MNIIDLHHEINAKSTNWSIDVSSKINENDTITITVPGCSYLFELTQDDQNPDIIYGGIYVNDDTHEAIENDYCYDGESGTVEEVAQDIVSDIQHEMVDHIENVRDIKAGDRVYFHDDPNGYEFMFREHGHYLRVSLCESDAPSWLRDALSDDVMVDESYFDHAERPKQSWPEPDGTKTRMYLGADGERYIYVPSHEFDQWPWLYDKDGYYAWTDAEALAKKRQEALPLREFTTPEEEA